MLDFNDQIVFTRYSNIVVNNWQSGRPEIFAIESPAYLQVAVSGVTPGTLYIHGLDANSTPMAETLSFIGGSTYVSSGQFKSVAGLTASWSSYTVNVVAVNSQGAPVNRPINYGPYLCSVSSRSDYVLEESTGVPGVLRGVLWRVSILGFQPLSGDFALTAKGAAGVVADVQPIEIPNFPSGYLFKLEENPA